MPCLNPIYTPGCTHFTKNRRLTIYRCETKNIEIRLFSRDKLTYLKIVDIWGN